LTLRPRPHPRPQGGDLNLGDLDVTLDLDFSDLALDLGDLALDLDDLGLGLKTVTMMASGRKVASHPRQEVAPYMCQT
jgi:hypothetical protein